MSRKMSVLTVATLLLVGLTTGPAGPTTGVRRARPARPASGTRTSRSTATAATTSGTTTSTCGTTRPPTSSPAWPPSRRAPSRTCPASTSTSWGWRSGRSPSTADDAAWSRDGQELTVTPQDVLPDGDDVHPVVSYDGVPQTIVDPLLGLSGFIPTDDGAIVAGQPDSAATWFPANDHPRDAASVDVTATVPEGLEAISNGVLEGQADQRRLDDVVVARGGADGHLPGDPGDRRVRRPRAPGRRHPVLGRPRPRPVPASPSGNPDGSTFGEVADGSLARQPEIIDFLRRPSGPTPSAPPAASSTTTRSSASRWRPRPGRSTRGRSSPTRSAAISSSCTNWRTSGRGTCCVSTAWQHLWLNEGFATYTEWLWLERTGVLTLPEIFDFLTGIPAADPFWDVMTGSPGPADLFDVEAVYLRGGLTLHALRLEVGDAVFFGIVTEWVASQAGGTVTTDEFIALAEETSGRQLDDFFQAWLFTAEKPAGPARRPCRSRRRRRLSRSAAACPGRPRR